METASLRKGHATFINRMNKIRVLDLIRNRKEISRAEIVKETGLSAPTVTRVVDSLINDERLVVECGIGDSTGGRRPILIRFNGADRFVIGIDLGTTEIRGVLSDLSANFVAERREATDIAGGFSRVMDQVGDIVRDLSGRQNIASGAIFGVGIAIPGLIDKEKEIVEFSPDLHWRHVDVKQALSSQFDLPVIFDNVTRVIALGELRYGVGTEYTDFICINIGFGIGGGVIINGKILDGCRGMAGEIGHTIIDIGSDRECQCGNRGCLEALASGRGIALSAREALAAGKKSVLLEKCGGDASKISAQMVTEAAAEGDRLAEEIFEQATELIGIGVSNMINLFNPQAILLGGGVTRVGSSFFQQVKRSVGKRSLNQLAEIAEILPMTHGDNASVMGAVSLILGEVLELNYENVPAD